jgi:hypothetical protein
MIRALAFAAIVYGATVAGDLYDRFINRNREEHR